MGLTVVGNSIEGRCGAETLAFEVDNGLGAVADKAAVSEGDGFPSEVARGFVANSFELESVVSTDLAASFQEEEFLVELGVLEVANTAEIEAETINGAHAQGRVFTGVVDVLDPASEVIIEFPEGGDVLQVLIEILVTNCAKKSFYFSLRSSVTHGCVQ